MTLQVTGLQVEMAEGGSEAIRMATERKYAAILMDVQMPEIDGLMATQRIRSQTDGAMVPIIAMTANAFEEDVQETRRAGMDAHLSKPIDPELLYGTLQSCILSGEAEKRRKNEA